MEETTTKSSLVANAYFLSCEQIWMFAGPSATMLLASPFLSANHCSASGASQSSQDQTLGWEVASRGGLKDGDHVDDLVEDEYSAEKRLHRLGLEPPQHSFIPRRI